MALSSTSYWICAILSGLALCYSTAAAATDADKLPTARTPRENHLQYITTEPELEVCEGENVTFIFNMTIPTNLSSDRLYERTVWSPHKKDHCVIHQNISKCHGSENFIQRAEISETWFPVAQGEHTRHGKLRFQLNHISIGKTGYYQGELKTGYNINNVNVKLIVKESSACPQKPEGGDTTTVQANTDLETARRNGFGVGFGAGFGACLGLVVIVDLIAKTNFLKCKGKGEKPPDVPV